MPLVRTANGKSFAAAEGQALLEAALNASVALDYSCRTGRCSTCKSQVRAGTTVPLHDELGLTAPEQAAGWILTCVRAATSDVELDIEDLGDLKLPAAKIVPCRIDALELVSPDVMKVVLRLPPAIDFDFRPGQYVNVIGPNSVRRSYSIANAPAANQRIELHVRQVVDGAMSDYWFAHAKVNDLLRLHGPLGTFFLRDDAAGQDLIFLATGTGIAPVKAILEGLAREQRSAPPRSVAVLWGGRVQSDLYWNNDGAGVDHRFTPVLSRSGSDWQGARGHVQDVLLEGRHDWPRALVYACGSEAMILSARHQLTAAGLDERRFRSDAFVASAAV